MKKALIILVGSIVISMSLSAQSLKGLDYISPFHQDVAAIQKGDQWGFINTEGDVVVELRRDLLVGQMCEMECCTNDSTLDYPFFKDGRALIKKDINGITHYGYIDPTGTTVIDPEFVNAAPFHYGLAVVLKVFKEVLGENNLLGKSMVKYSYNEIVIDPNGATKAHLRGPFNLLYDKEKMKSPPKIQSRVLNPQLVAIKTQDNIWEVHTIDKE